MVLTFCFIMDVGFCVAVFPFVTCLQLLLMFPGLCPDNSTLIVVLLQFVLELCRGNGVANIKAIQGHLDKIHTCCLELSTSEHMVSL